VKLVIANNVRPPFLDELVAAARAGKVVYQIVAPEAVDSLCGRGVRHQGVACRVTEAPLLELEPFLNTLPEGAALLVVLDHVEDPQNLGAIIRSAEAAGAAAVVIPKRRSAPPGGVVMKVSAGAAARLPLVSVPNITASMERLNKAGFWTVGMTPGAGDSRAESIWDSPLPPRTALVIGSEGDGLSRLVSETCDQLVHIPISGAVGSLNAASAAAVGMFEWRRVNSPR
jgi:23S rRNA (guanosine2251-2'-O)-methyltransferase